MIINQLTEQELNDIKFLDKLLEAVATKFTPNKFQGLNETTTRQTILENFGERAFLLPQENKFPIVNPDTGEIDCRLLYISRLKAKQYGLNEIEEKATMLYNQHMCNCQVNVNIEGHSHGPYDLIELLNLLEIDFKSIRGNNLNE